jgi:hypothetical protein
MTHHSRARPNSTALIPGITLTREEGSDGLARWRVRAVAQVGGKQERMSASPLRYGLNEALRLACEWRAARLGERAPPVVTDMVSEARAAVTRESMREMRNDGVSVR